MHAGNRTIGRDARHLEVSATDVPANDVRVFEKRHGMPDQVNGSRELSTAIIPVIDILEGVAVHARKGERHAYRPLRSVLGCSPEPADVLRACLELYPFPAFYIADLDALTGRGDNIAAVTSLAGNFPGVEIWLDAGVAGFGLDVAGVVPVIGSETGVPPARVERMYRSHRTPVLSLDYRGGQLLGDPGMPGVAATWPGPVLVIDVRIVGTDSGPPLALAAPLLGGAGKAPGGVYVGGGVRHMADIESILSAGARGALVATAIHSGALSGSDVAEIMQKKPRP